MATVNREEVTVLADGALLARMRQIASDDEREFEAVLEDAMRVYVRLQQHEGVRPEVAAHLKASMERHRRLYELLAQ